MRRIAASIVVMPDGTRLVNHVVELRDGVVENVYLLKDELPMTEWYSGSITVGQDGRIHIK